MKKKKKKRSHSHTWKQIQEKVEEADATQDVNESL